MGPQRIGRYVNIFGFNIIDLAMLSSYIGEDRKRHMADDGDECNEAWEIER
jgi:hypothetical protein